MLSKEEEFISRFAARASHAAQVQSRVKKLEKIDRVEVMVARIKSDMDKVERQLIEAESTVPADQTLQPLRAFIKPAFIFVSYVVSASKGTTKISPDEKVQKLKIVVLTTRRRCRAYRTWLCSLYRVIRLGWF